MLDDGLATFGVKVERRAVSAGLTYVPALPYHRLSLHLGRPVNASCRCGDQRGMRVQSHGDIDIVPAGLDGEWEDDRDCTILRVAISPALLRRAAQELEIDPDRVTLAPKFQHRDARIEHIALALETQLGTDIRTDRLVTESLGTALAIQLLGNQVRWIEPAAKQTLSPSQKRRLAAFIESHLEDDLSLAHLTQVVGISVSHLKVLFRRSFGMPVHQYVIRRRVERAQALIMSGELPLSQIALMTGFAHQSHMTSMMKRFLGVTPANLTRIKL